MNRKKIPFIFTALLSCIVYLVACTKFEPALPAADQVLDGPVDGLTFEQNAQFLAGDRAFNAEIFTAAKGLGPLFVSNSCGSCHAGDGKGTPFTTLTRFGQTDSTGNQFLHSGGPQLQNRALPGYVPEIIPAAATFSKFTPPANTGLGFIELVSDAVILAMADPDDMDGDGISGVPCWNHVPDYVKISPDAIPNNGKYICRFGKKAAAYDLLNQTVNAYNQDMGITSSFNLLDAYTGQQADAEITDKTVRDVVAYLQMLKAPVPRNQDNAEVQQGKSIFMQIQCSNCHRPQLQTAYSAITALSYKTFYPYTDLLLHDMGPALDDGYTEASARTSEWRTPALWGLGLSPASQGGQYYLLHDGRAHSIEEAILLHGGEAANSVQHYQQLSEGERNALIKFLKSL
jgi:CxxC motif-containing protein (DUF1111 family)